MKNQMNKFKKTNVCLCALVLAAVCMPVRTWAGGEEDSVGGGKVGIEKTLLAIPFSVSEGVSGDGESIATSFTRSTGALYKAFDSIIKYDSATKEALQSEMIFTKESGLVDIEKTLELGKQLGASHVLAGYVRRIDDKDLIIATILDTESLEMIAGVYYDYDSIESLPSAIPRLAEQLSTQMRRPPRNDDLALSAPPFPSNDIADGQVLARLVACELVQWGRVAVLPRTDDVQKIITDEYKRREEGPTQGGGGVGIGRPADYVLAGSFPKFGENTFIGADFISLSTQSTFVHGSDVAYKRPTESSLKIIKRFCGDLKKQLTELSKQPRGTYERTNPWDKLRDTQTELAATKKLLAQEQGEKSTAQSAVEALKTQLTQARSEAQQEKSAAAQAQTAQTQAIAEQNNAQQAQRQAEQRKAESEAATVAAGRALEEAQKQRDEFKTQAEQARTAQNNAIHERNIANQQKSAAEQDRDRAKDAQRQAEQQMTAAQTAQRQVERERDAANQARTVAETAKANAEAARDIAVQATQAAQADKRAAEQARVTAERERDAALRDKSTLQSKVDALEKELAVLKKQLEVLKTP